MIPFSRYNHIGLTFSALLIAFSVYAMTVWGFRYSVEFVGGTNLVYSFSTDITREGIQKGAEEQGIEIQELRIQDRQMELRAHELDEKQQAAFKNQLEQQFEASVEIVRAETVGPSISKDLLRKTLIALAIGVCIIFGYITYAFQNFRYAVAAVVALLHDVCILLGVYATLSYFFRAEVDTLLVTALLTTMSLSIHDTIVMFDKIREHSRRGVDNIETRANRALTETLVRSLNSSLTTGFMLVSLLLLGGSTIRFFIAALLTGVLIGTYSSPFIAVPIAVRLERMRKS